MTKTEKSYFKIAKNISELSNHKQKLGAVVVSKHRVISTGYNSYTRRHGLQAKLNLERYGEETPGYIHAETAALLPFIQNHIDLAGSTIFVYRALKDGRCAMARHCSSCMKLIQQCGIKKIYYTTDDGYAKEYRTNESN